MTTCEPRFTASAITRPTTSSPESRIWPRISSASSGAEARSATCIGPPDRLGHVRRTSSRLGLTSTTRVRGSRSPTVSRRAAHPLQLVRGMLGLPRACRTVPGASSRSVRLVVGRLAPAPAEVERVELDPRVPEPLGEGAGRLAAAGSADEEPAHRLRRPSRPDTRKQRIATAERASGPVGAPMPLYTRLSRPCRGGGSGVSMRDRYSRFAWWPAVGLLVVVGAALSGDAFAAKGRKPPVNTTPSDDLRDGARRPRRSRPTGHVDGHADDHLRLPVAPLRRRAAPTAPTSPARPARPTRSPPPTSARRSASS